MRKRPITLDAPIELQAAAADSGKRPTFRIVAYSGGPLTVAGWPLPVVIDIAGLKAKARVPVLWAHDALQVLGQSTEVTKSVRSVELVGTITGEGEVAQDVVAHARNGFIWSASVGVFPLKVVDVRAGATVAANGRTFTGPLYFFPKSELHEVSILSIGADGDAEARIAARRKESSMFGKKKRATAAADNPPVTPIDDDGTDAVQVAVLAERERLQEIDGICAGMNNSRLMQARARAIEGEIELDELKDVALSVLRASRNAPLPPSAHVLRSGGAGADQPRELLACAFLMHVGQHSTAEKAFGAQLCTAASDLRIRHAMDLCEAALHLTPSPLGMPSSPNELIRAAFSSMSLPAALMLAGDKMLAETYAQTPATFRSWCGKNTNKNFRPHTRIRPYLKNAGFDKVPATGELDHASADEETYSTMVDTYGKLLMVSRKDIVNDDLGVFPALYRELALQALLKVSDLVYKALLANADSFFGADNKNYYSGADSALGISGLAYVVTLLRKQKDGAGRNIAFTPRVLVVPPELEHIARQILNSTSVQRDQSADQQATGNPLADLNLTLEIEPRLSDSDFHASASDKGWYLFAGSSNPTLTISYLNGVEAPTVEQVDPGADKLGVGMRGFLDFGVDQADSRSGVFSKGSA